MYTYLLNLYIFYINENVIQREQRMRTADYGMRWMMGVALEDNS